MNWQYGITTVAERIDSLLPRTIASLASAGFDEPLIFIDENPKLKTFSRWLLTAWELYLREPHAQRYAIFQDDLVAVLGLRKYLEHCEYPKDGYWNLYTFPSCVKPVQGWDYSLQNGRGAVGLVFDNDNFRRLLASNDMVNKPQATRKPYSGVDGAILRAMNNMELKEYTHTPSLLQHTGLHSSMGNKSQPLADSFPGEEFDATSLIRSKPARVSRIGLGRIGLVGFNCTTGLGEHNRQLATYGDVDRWLVKPHSRHGINPPHPDVDTLVCRESNKIEGWLKEIDTVLFVEKPVFSNLTGIVKHHKKRVVCIPNQERMPEGFEGWPKEVDLFICPTEYTYDQFKDHLPCVHFPWPVDTERFKPSLRTNCDRFLFVNGWGGLNARKGAPIICELCERWPTIPLTIISQQSRNWPDGPNIRIVDPPTENSGLYQHGDVLLAPHSIDGLGLCPMEAMSCGMPVITTDGNPWNEFPAIGRIRSTVKTVTFNQKVEFNRKVEWHTPEVEALSTLCKHILGRDITNRSQEVLDWADQRSWNKHSKTFNDIVRRGSPNE